MWVDWGLESYLFLTKLYLANGCGDMFHRERSVSVVLSYGANFVARAGSWDAVVTCFFIDTAHNIIEYIEIISRILKDGGVSSSICTEQFHRFFFFFFFPPLNVLINWSYRFG